MDNVHFKKLPSEVLPTVTGNNVVIAETASGKLWWCDSDGAKRLIDVDTAFPIGVVVESDNNQSPAEYIGGTWEAIANRAGEVSTMSSDTGYMNISSGIDTILTTITIPANTTAYVYGQVEGDLPDGGSIMNVQLKIPGREVNCRTTLNNGGGCIANIVVAPADTDTVVELHTYNYRSTATPFKGTIQALLIKQPTTYCWKRVA